MSQQDEPAVVDAQNPVAPLVDDGTLSESERQINEIFERRGQSSEGDDTTASADETDTTGTPGSPVDSAASDETPPVEGQAVSSEPVPPEGQPTGEGGATGAEPVQSAPAFTFAGTDYNTEQLARAVQVNDWFSRLNNDQVLAIDALLSGQYRLAPANEAAPVVPPTTQPTSPVSGSIPPESEAGEWLDPRAEAEITRLRTELDTFKQQFTQSLTPVVQSQQDAQRTHYLNLIESATTQFATDYSLSPEQTDAVVKSLNEAQVLQSLAQRHGGDISAAMRTGLEMMFWTTPAYRDPYLSSRNNAELATLSEAQQQERVKQQKLTALSTGGGSVPRRDPIPSNSQDRWAAVKDEVAQAMNGQ